MKARIAIVSGLLLSAAGCAAHMGKNTTEGALQSFSDSVAPEPGQRPMEAVAGRAVKGAVDELSDPEEVARIQAVARAAGESLRRSLVEGLARDLGPEGQGHLADTLAATVRRASTEAVLGARKALLASCDPAEPGCLDRRLSDLAGNLAVSFTDGVKRSLGVPALIAAFVAGAASALLAMAVWIVLRGARRGGRRERARGLEPASGPARA